MALPASDASATASSSLHTHNNLVHTAVQSIDHRESSMLQMRLLIIRKLAKIPATVHALRYSPTSCQSVLQSLSVYRAACHEDSRQRNTVVVRGERVRITHLKVAIQLLHLAMPVDIQRTIVSLGYYGLRITDVFGASEKPESHSAIDFRCISGQPGGS